MIADEHVTTPWTRFSQEHAAEVRESNVTEETFYLVYFWSRRMLRTEILSTCSQATQSLQGDDTSNVALIEMAPQDNSAEPVNDCQMIHEDLESSGDVEFVDENLHQRTSGRIARTKVSLHAPTASSSSRKWEQAVEVKAWIKVTDFLFQLVRQAPYCPAAILREVYRSAGSAVKCDNELARPAEDARLLDKARMVKQGEDMQTCIMIHALLPALSKNCGLAYLVMFSLLLRLRGTMWESADLLQPDTDVYKVTATGQRKTCKSHANKALYMTCTMCPKSFFGVLLLNYMGLNRGTLDAFDSAMLKVYLSIFTKRISSVADILPDTLKNSKAWEETIVPCLDFIVFDLIDILEKLHRTASEYSFTLLPTCVQQLFPHVGRRHIATRLCVSSPSRLEQDLYVDFPHFALLHDGYMQTRRVNKEKFEEGTHRHMSSIRVEASWYADPTHQRRSVQRERNFHAFAALLQKTSTQAATAFSSFSHTIDKLPALERNEDDRGLTATPFDLRSAAASRKQQIQALTQYQPFLLFTQLTFMQRDSLVRQAAQLVLTSVIEQTQLGDQSPALSVAVKVEQEAYTITTGDTSVKYTA